jgi:hypothetical protein
MLQGKSSRHTHTHTPTTTNIPVCTQRVPWRETKSLLQEARYVTTIILLGPEWLMSNLLDVHGKIKGEMAS